MGLTGPYKGSGREQGAASCEMEDNRDETAAWGRRARGERGNLGMAGRSRQAWLGGEPTRFPPLAGSR